MNYTSLFHKLFLVSLLGWTLIPLGCKQNSTPGTANVEPPQSLEGTVWVSKGNETFAEVTEDDSLPVVYNFTWKFFDDTTLLTTIDVTQVVDGFSNTRSISEDLRYVYNGSGGTYTMHIPDMKTFELVDYPQPFAINWQDSTLTVDLSAIPDLYPGITGLTFTLQKSNNQ